MKKISLVFLLSALVGCAGFETLPDGYNFGLPPSNIDKKIINHFEPVLQDPSSAKYRIGKPFKAYQNHGLVSGGGIAWAGYAVNVSINAKNIFGIMAGFNTYRVYFNGETIRSHCEYGGSYSGGIMDDCDDILFNRVTDYD